MSETTATTIAHQLATVARITGGRAWGLHCGQPRVYLKSRRDVTLYIEFPDAAYSDPDAPASDAAGLGGPRLRCHVAECGQAPAWYRSQRRIAAGRVASHLAAAVWYVETGNEDEAQRIVDDELVITGEAIGHLANGRVDEARRLVGLATD